MAGPHHFIPLPDEFEVEVPSKTVKAKHYLKWSPSGIYITWNYQRIWLNYAGEKAGESYISFELPSDPGYLRDFSEAILELADKIERRDY